MDTKTTTQTIGERIHELRTALQLNLNAFAKQLGLSSGTVCNYEKNRRAVPESILHLICRVYFAEYDFLKYGHGEMFQKHTNDVFAALSEEYHLSKEDLTVIENFIRLSPEERSAIIAFMKALI